MAIKALCAVFGCVFGCLFHRWWIAPDIKNIRQELAEYKTTADRNK
jgi:hypothetical protein